MLKKSIVISVCGHLALFSVFNLSFGKALFKLDCPTVNFWGQILPKSAMVSSASSVNLIRGFLISSPNKLLVSQKVSSLSVTTQYHIKPQVILGNRQEKIDFIPKPLSPSYFSLRRKESVVMLHPQLPYYFNLLFKDRETVHIELQFNIVMSKNRRYTVVKRKISSGNLEADLLSMRYIGHYLSIQNKKFFPNAWQTIKIDLSIRNSGKTDND